jgi:hypothetical protein
MPGLIARLDARTFPLYFGTNVPNSLRILQRSIDVTPARPQPFK